MKATIRRDALQAIQTQSTGHSEPRPFAALSECDRPRQGRRKASSDSEERGEDQPSPPTVLKEKALEKGGEGGEGGVGDRGVVSWIVLSCAIYLQRL